jgi:hypothetical protein
MLIVTTRIGESSNSIRVIKLSIRTTKHRNWQREMETKTELYQKRMKLSLASISLEQTSRIISN